MMKWLIGCCLFFMLSGCGIVYHPTIQQGNILKDSIIERLKIGMTKEQVRYLLGSCVLETPFHSNRKDYLYFYQPGYGQSNQKRITLIFSNNYLISIKNS